MMVLMLFSVLGIFKYCCLFSILILQREKIQEIASHNIKFTLFNGTNDT